MNIRLIGIDRALVAAWRAEFSGQRDVEVIDGSIFDFPSDGIVSPANSFGVMDGGLDGKLRDFFGLGIESLVRSAIQREYQGEMPVGCATIVETGDPRFRYLISAPTMRVPERVADTLNAYLAMRAILIKATAWKLESVAIPGLCALSGGMAPEVVARQMRTAYEKIVVGSIAYTHWREEKQLQDYLRCRTDALPYDYESPPRFR
jgi:O-acetyl-ADP-ribose deacetylase (regulator of RNase III)